MISAATFVIIGLAFFLGIGVGATVGTLSLLRASDERNRGRHRPKHEKGNSVPEASSQANDQAGSGEYKWEATQETRQELPTVVSATTKWSFGMTDFASPQHHNTRTFLGNYKTVRSDGIPDESELEELYAIAGREDASE